MLSGLSKIFNYFAGHQVQVEETYDDQFVPQTLTQTDCREHERSLVGQVTSLHSGYGLIDHEIYFEFTSVQGNIRPQLGDQVRVKAKRSHGDGGWKAERVEMVDDDDDWNNRKSTCSGSQQSVIGIITDVVSDCVTVNQDLRVAVSAFSDTYQPVVGDWVVVSFSDDQTTVVPLREQSYEGQVNSVQQQQFGFIDSDVYFTFTVCINGYKPRRGDWVSAQIIESSQGKCCWRAVAVSPKPRVDSLKKNVVSAAALPALGGFMQELLRDKNGIIITENLDFKQLNRGQKKELTITIRNSAFTWQTLLKYSFKCDTDCQFAVSPVVTTKEPPGGGDSTTAVFIPPNSSVKMEITCVAKYPGTDRQLLVFDFKKFKIGRHVHVAVVDSHEQLLNPVTPYDRRARLRDRKAPNVTPEWVVPGQKPKRSSLSVKLPSRLPQYRIPQELRDCVSNKLDLSDLIPELSQSLDLENYATRLGTLLHLEEIQMEIDIREYDMLDQCLRSAGEFLVLRVGPGLAEGRPSVLVGDTIILAHPEDHGVGVQYEGCVHEVLSEDIKIKCHSEFHLKYNGESYDIMFNFNRTSLRRCHQAVSMALSLGKEVLFPKEVNIKDAQVKITSHKSRARHSSKNQGPRKQPSDALVVNTTPLASADSSDRDGVCFFNKNLNQRQRAAVVRILAGHCRPTPYILFGPPGTGKTVTVVEAMLQVFHHVPRSRIIACTPSNSAADLLTERLLQSGALNTGDLVRLNAFQRNEDGIPESIKLCCSYGDDLPLVVRHRIVICTCVTSGLLYSLKLKAGHFTHVFVDEAGQATEPECLIPLGLCAESDGQIVLAGDPLQLGPVLRSRFAQIYGLGYSLLERLMNRTLYSRNEAKFADHGSYDPLLVTKLVDNYRCHPVLLELPSTLFYHGELLNKADSQLTHCLCDWHMLPSNGRPMIFHGVNGEDLREGNSPSWFNAVEAVQVVSYLQALVDNTCHPLTHDDIGIITPYRKQVEKIRLLIDRLGMDKVKVGSVEEFQGQERLVIIISTVRSSASLLSFDQVHNLGFLSNPKRFNVGITRAQALLVIVGDPHLLSHDVHWVELLKYCIKNNTYTGCSLPDQLSSVVMEMIQASSNQNGVPDELSSVVMMAASNQSDILPDKLSSVKTEMTQAPHAQNDSYPCQGSTEVLPSDKSVPNSRKSQCGGTKTLFYGEACVDNHVSHERAVPSLHGNSLQVETPAEDSPVIDSGHDSDTLLLADRNSEPRGNCLPSDSVLVLTTGRESGTENCTTCLPYNTQPVTVSEGASETEPRGVLCAGYRACISSADKQPAPSVDDITKHSVTTADDDQEKCEDRESDVLCKSQSDTVHTSIISADIASDNSGMLCISEEEDLRASDRNNIYNAQEGSLMQACPMNSAVLSYQAPSCEGVEAYRAIADADISSVAINRHAIGEGMIQACPVNSVLKSCVEQSHEEDDTDSTSTFNINPAQGETVLNSCCVSSAVLLNPESLYEQDVEQSNVLYSTQGREEGIIQPSCKEDELLCAMNCSDKGRVDVSNIAHGQDDGAILNACPVNGARLSSPFVSSKDGEVLCAAGVDVDTTTSSDSEYWDDLIQCEGDVVVETSSDEELGS